MSKKISEKQTNSQEQKADTPKNRKPYTEPRLASVKPKFIEPELTKHKAVGGVIFNGASFGPFSVD